MPMRPWSGRIRAISPMVMPQMPWMDGMSQRSLQQADGKTWMWGKPSWAELGKWIGWCVVDWWRKLWIVSRSRRSVGGTSKSQVVCFDMFVHWGFFLVLKFLTRSAFAEKKNVGTWLRNLIIYLQILVFLSLHPPFFWLCLRIFCFLNSSTFLGPQALRSLISLIFPGIKWLDWDGQSDWCRREFEVVGGFTIFLRPKCSVISDLPWPFSGVTFWTDHESIEALRSATADDVPLKHMLRIHGCWPNPGKNLKIMWSQAMGQTGTSTNQWMVWEPVQSSRMKSYKRFLSSGVPTGVRLLYRVTCIHILNMKIWNDYQNEGSAIFGSNIMSFGPGPSFHIFDAGDHRWTGRPGAMTSSTSFSMSEQPGLHAFDFPKRWKWVCFF